MQRIQKLRQTYRIRQDIRVEPVRIGKYIYLVLLLGVLLTVVHVLLGHIYLLRGDGFVYADNEEVALEFDATVKELMVVEGTRVQPGDLVLSYESIEIRQKLIDLALQLSQLHQRLDNARIDLIRVTTNLAAANKYARFSGELEASLNRLKDRGLVATPQISAEVERSFEATQSLAAYQAEKQQIESSLKVLQQDIQRVEKHYDKLLLAFNDGNVTARREGIITNLNIAQGSVIQKGEPVLRIFGRNRYLLCYFDERSFVTYVAGDQVFVNLPGQIYTVGRIKELARVSNPLPEEFQPRFKPKERQQLAVIEVEPKLLQNITILSKVSISKPLGMQFILKAMAWFD